MGMAEVEKLIEIYQQLEDAGLMVVAGKKDTAELMVSRDVVPVVRCKDCKYFVQGEPYDPCECMKWMVKFGVAYTTPDGYCHKAERRTDGR